MYSSLVTGVEKTIKESNEEEEQRETSMKWMIHERENRNQLEFNKLYKLIFNVMIKRVRLKKNTNEKFILPTRCTPQDKGS